MAYADRKGLPKVFANNVMYIITEVQVLLTYAYNKMFVHILDHVQVVHDVINVIRTRDNVGFCVICTV